MPDNWLALCAAILNPNLSVDKALIKMGIGQAKPIKKADINSTDIESMIRMRQQGMTYNEIGAIYGMNDQTVNKRIKRYKQKMKVS